MMGRCRAGVCCGKRDRGERGRARLVVALMAALAVGGLGARTALAQHATTLTTEVPLALEERMGQMLEILRGDFTKLTDENFSEAFRSELPLERFSEALRRQREDSGGYKALGSQRLDNYTMSARLRSVKDGTDWTLTITIEKKRPYAIDSASMKAVPTRSKEGYPGWALLDADLEGVVDRSGFALYEIEADGSLRAVHRVRADRRMAVGLAAQIWTLLAVAEMVKNGEASWDQTLAIQDESRSLPGLGFGLSPKGMAYPLRDYAVRMFRDRDTTAADHLLAFAGRDRVEALRARDRIGEDGPGSVLGMPAKAEDPFLSTNELYRLTCSPETLPLRRYIEADAASRRRIIREELPAIKAVYEVFESWTRPREVERIGWFSTPDELCRAAARVWTLGQEAEMRGATLEALKPAAELPIEWSLWKYVGVSTGGLPGVFSGTWLYERTDGRVFVMAFVFNNPNQLLSEDRIGGIIAASEALVGRMEVKGPNGKETNGK